MSNEMIFYLGIGSMICSLVSGIVFLVAAKINWIRLEKKMDREYGKIK